MNNQPTTRIAVAQAAAHHGLILRGGFAVAAEDAVPMVSGARAARSLLLFGQIGGSIWPAFSQSPQYRDGRPQPLNRWSASVAMQLAARFDAQPLYPFGGPPYHPFIRWAQKAEALRPSRLGLLIHPEYGLWHAYRFALAFAELLPDLVPPQPHADICAACESEACLTACPVDAFDGQRYAVDACARYLTAEPTADCHQHGCRARTACPQATAYHYPAAQAAFHIAQFLHSPELRKFVKQGSVVGGQF